MARTKAFDPTKALTKALNLFWEQGYEATSMQDLVRVMGLSRSSIYDTFGDKLQLYQTALQRYIELGRASQQAMISSAPTARKATLALFDDLLEAVEAETVQRGCFVVNCAVEFGQSDEQTAKFVAQSFDISEQVFVDLVKRGQTEGEISAELNPVATGRFLFNTFCGLRVLAKGNRNRETLQDVINTAMLVLG